MLGGSTSTPWTTSNGTNEGALHTPHQRRGHRRTVSDGLIFASPSMSSPERARYPTAPFRSTIDDAVDLERGDVGREKSADDAILPVNNSSHVLG